MYGDIIESIENLIYQLIPAAAALEGIDISLLADVQCELTDIQERLTDAEYEG